MSDLLTRGLDRRDERASLAICLVVAIAYVAAFAWLLHASVPFDQVFITRRQEVLLQHLSEHPWRIGQTVDVSARSYPEPSLELLAGWSAIEETGIWSQAAEADFAFQLPAGQPAPLSLELRGSVMPDASGHQGFRLDVNGQPIGTWNVVGGATRLCAVLPEWARNAVGPLQASLFIDHPTRPPGGKDLRGLGLFLRQVAVLPEPCDAAPSSAAGRPGG